MASRRAVQPIQVVLVLSALAVLSKRAHPLCEGAVGRHERARVPDRAEVLARVEAERRRGSHRSGPTPPTSRAMGLARVLDHRRAVAARELVQPRRISHLAVEMHRDDGTRTLADGGCCGASVDAIVGLRHVHRNGRRTHLRNRLPGRDEGRGRYDHLVPGTDARRLQRKPKSVEPARHADAVFRVARACEGGLELEDCRAVDERRALEGIGDVRKDVVADVVKASAEVEERHCSR